MSIAAFLIDIDVTLKFLFDLSSLDVCVFSRFYFSQKEEPG